MNLQSQAICVYKKKFQTMYISILEDGASGEQVGDIERIIVKNLFNITWNWWIFKKNLLWPQVYNEFKEYVKKIQVQNI